VSGDKHRRRRRRRERRDDDRDGSDQVKPLTDEVREQIAEWAQEAAEANGLGLFDYEPGVRGRWIIRIYVERLGEIDDEEEDAIGVDECAEVSRYIEAYMDADDRVPEDYVLEVSSPGLERPLKKPRHVQRAVGEQVQLVTREQVDGKNKFVAELVGFEDGILELELEDREEPARVAWDDVKKGRLKYDF
jgi:ribosome maturation factor RimP